MKPIHQDFEGCFRIDPDIPIDALLKSGILRSFEMSVKRRGKTVDQARRITVDALDLLTQVDTRQPSQKSRCYKRPLGMTFFSSRNNCLIEFVPDGVRPRAQSYSMDKLPNPKQKLSQKHQANETFKRNTAKFLDESYANGDPEQSILTGVFWVLESAENFAGAFIDVFKEQQPLFGKLRQVYESVDKEGIDSSRGCYNNAMAVDVYLASEELKRAELRREDDSFFMEG